MLFIFQYFNISIFHKSPLLWLIRCSPSSSLLYAAVFPNILINVGISAVVLVNWFSIEEQSLIVCRYRDCLEQSLLVKTFLNLPKSNTMQSHYHPTAGLRWNWDTRPPCKVSPTGLYSTEPIKIQHNLPVENNR